MARIVKRLGLGHTVRDPWRPKKKGRARRKEEGGEIRWDVPFSASPFPLVPLFRSGSAPGAVSRFWETVGEYAHPTELTLGLPMATFAGRFRYSIPAQLSAEGLDTTIYANFTWAVENREGFPRELCPDAWKWFPHQDAAKLPREVHYIPRGSWLSARLAQLLGGQDHFARLIREGADISGQKELHLDIDVAEATDGRPVGRFTLKFDLEMMRLEGRCLRGFHFAISDDFQAVLCSAPLSVARCDLRLGDDTIGWDGKQYFGEGMRRSRFADLQDEHARYETLKSLAVELENGDDSIADDPALFTRIGEYLALETADCEFIERNLKYLRSAVIDDCRYWIWEYRESDGTRSFVTLQLDGHRSSLALQDAGDLSPEQHIYAEHYDYFAEGDA